MTVSPLGKCGCGLTDRFYLRFRDCVWIVPDGAVFVAPLLF
jgi:hypothetical protein